MVFEKYHGTGNDFILLKAAPTNPSELAKRICDRHFGIGADGILYPTSSSIADLKMNYYNSDGSIAPMCGNGMRCFAAFALKHGLIHSTSVSIETLAGIIPVSFDAAQDLIKIDLGVPITSLNYPDVEKPITKFAKHSLVIEGEQVDFYVLNMGTIHTVIYLDDHLSLNWRKIAEPFSKHPFFPKQTNVNFVEVLDEYTQKVTTFERGAGWTLSCGTGSSASAAVSVILGKTKNIVETIVPGGTLSVYVHDRIELAGPAAYIASGNYEV
jgi:diaminopimelate epimerase